MQSGKWTILLISFITVLTTDALLAQDSVAIRSENGQYTGVITHLEGATSKKDYYGTSRFQLFDAEGTLLWQKEYQVMWDEFQPNFYVSPHGKTVEMNPDGNVIFYNWDGTIIKKLNNYFDSWQTTTTTQRGDYVSISVRVRDEYKISLFTMEGQMQWEQQVHIQSTRLNSIAHEGKYVTVSGYESGIHSPLYMLLGKNGKIIKEFKNVAVTDDNFSKSGNYLVVNEGAGDRAILIDIKAKKIIWKYNPKELIVGADVSEDTYIMLGLGKQRRGGRVSDLKIVVLGIDGREYERIPVEGDMVRIREVKLDYDDELNKVTLNIGSSKKEYLINIE